MKAPTVWFDVPDAFAALDLGDDPGPRIARLAAPTTGLTDTQRLHLLLAQEYMVETMRREYVVYAAQCLVRVDGATPRLSVAQFTVSVCPAHVAGLVGVDVLDVVAARLDGVGPGREAPGREVAVLSLPAGRTLAVVEDRRFTTYVSALGVARRRDHVVRQVQLVVPFPDRRYLAVLALGTESLQDWENYLDLVGDIAASVRFSAPDAGGSDPGEVERGGHQAGEHERGGVQRAE